MRELTCIVCPKGCRLKVDETQNLRVSGNSCPRGEEYARAELTSPTRALTSTVRIEGALYRRCPVRTDGVIPKGLIREAMELLDTVTLEAPVKRGQVVVDNIVGTGVRFVTSREMRKVGN